MNVLCCDAIPDCATVGMVHVAKVVVPLPSVAKILCTDQETVLVAKGQYRKTRAARRWIRAIAKTVFDDAFFIARLGQSQ